MEIQPNPTLSIEVRADMHKAQTPKHFFVPSFLVPSFFGPTISLFPTSLFPTSIGFCARGLRTPWFCRRICSTYLPCFQRLDKSDRAAQNLRAKFVLFRTMESPW